LKHVFRLPTSSADVSLVVLVLEVLTHGSSPTLSQASEVAVLVQLHFKKTSAVIGRHDEGKGHWLHRFRM